MRSPGRTGCWPQRPCPTTASTPGGASTPPRPAVPRASFAVCSSRERSSLAVCSSRERSSLRERSSFAVCSSRERSSLPASHHGADVLAKVHHLGGGPPGGREDRTRHHRQR